MFFIKVDPFRKTFNNCPFSGGSCAVRLLWGLSARHGGECGEWRRSYQDGMPIRGLLANIGTRFWILWRCSSEITEKHRKNGLLKWRRVDSSLKNSVLLFSNKIFGTMWRMNFHIATWTASPLCAIKYFFLKSLSNNDQYLSNLSTFEIYLKLIKKMKMRSQNALYWMSPF